ncbi:MAG: DpnD/PcfM family protein [Faecalibacillus sp.]
MAKYRAEITETLQYQEVIEAENEQEALIKLKEKYHHQEIILNEENYVATDFKVIEKVKKKDEYVR